MKKCPLLQMLFKRRDILHRVTCIWNVPPLYTQQWRSTLQELQCTYLGYSHMQQYNTVISDTVSNHIQFIFLFLLHVFPSVLHVLKGYIGSNKLCKIDVTCLYKGQKKLMTASKIMCSEHWLMKSYFTIQTSRDYQIVNW